MELSRELGTGLCQVWATAALGQLELGLGDAAAAAAQFGRQQELLGELGISDADLSPAAELTDAWLRLGREDEARGVAAAFATAAEAKGQPWPRAGRCAARAWSPATPLRRVLRRALRLHAQTPDAFETARTQLAYGERLRRARNRVLAREQLRAARRRSSGSTPRPWADRAHAELAATGETLRRRDPARSRS